MRPTTRENNTAIFLLRAKELGLSIEELEQLDYGMVVDMLIEKGNDQEDYAYKATAEDYQAF